MGLAGWAQAVVHATQVLPPVPVSHFQTRDEYCKGNLAEVLSLACHGKFRLQTLHVLTSLARVWHFKPADVLKQITFQGCTCTDALGLLSQPWMTGARLDAHAFTELMQSSDAGGDEIKGLARNTVVDTTSFAALWVVCGHANARGAARITAFADKR